ncbi:acyl-CoA dehydrogenase [Streptomyces mashuensis]|uniref:Acyl-CoA dehydrogenase n=1 Tax=Streptomyces mashuensis TaxID=33904 RepID=A0A919AYF0_9ACTN|nr:acyl-CoA dehydrogenase family protein [Streptomyces mashuensis]GHF29415.1 acyl-CoA dehydrogenase [Streptomyces mashuensis]
MRFALDAEQREFGRVLDRMLGAADTPAAVRAWAGGDHGPGRVLWERLADAGVFGLAVAEKWGGAGLLPVETAVAFTELGRHCVPGPVVETVAGAVLLGRLAERGEPGPAERWLPAVAAGRARLSLALPVAGPYALDADVADAVLAVTGTELRLAPGCGSVRRSLDPARRPARPRAGGPVLARGRAVREAAAEAARWAAFATAAQALGAGRALLARSVEHARRRVQFGVPIGTFQAVKHRLADTLVALEFAEPLLHGAAVELGAGGAGTGVAAAKLACCEAAYAAGRTALQVHGALGYTAEYDLSLWLGKARALRSAWGGPEECRRRILDQEEHRPRLFHE